MKKIILLIWLILCSTLGYALDGDWKTHVVESREGYEEAIHWKEPVTYYFNYTKPKNSTMDSWLYVKGDLEICLKITLLDITFDVQSTGGNIPLGPMIRWKNIDWGEVEIIQIRYIGCK